MEEKEQITKASEETKSKKTNLLIHLIWAALGAIYLLGVFFYGHAPFASYANLDAGYSYGEFVFLGHVIPAILATFSFVGVVSLLFIPFTIVEVEERATVLLLMLYSVMGIGALVLFPNIFEPLGLLFFNSDSMGIPLFLAFVAPFYFGYFSLRDDFYCCDMKARFILIVGLIFTAVIGVIAFINASAIMYVGVLIALGVLFVVGLVTISMIPTMREQTVDAIVIIFKGK